MSLMLTFICDVDLDADSTCGRKLHLHHGATIVDLIEHGWSQDPAGRRHRCTLHSGVPPIPARVPQTRHDVPSGTANVPPASNVTPFRPRRT